MSIDNYTDREREFQREIERLRTEAVAADIRIGNDALVIAGLTAERDALARCKLADQDAYVAMRDQRDAALADLSAGCAKLQAEHDELRKSLADRDAKLSELHLQYLSDFGQLQAQEPTAMYLRECADGSLVQLYDDLKPGTKLYAAAAGAAPVPVHEGWQLVPIEPTDAMLVSARDWSYAKYGKPIGNAAAVGCWEAMLAAAPKEPT